MTSNDGEWGFAAPPYRAAEALVVLKRALRELGLTERGQGFEWAGRPVVRCEADASEIRVQLARRVQVHTPDWDASLLRSHADQRKWLDEVKKRLTRWRDDD